LKGILRSELFEKYPFSVRKTLCSVDNEIELEYEPFGLIKKMDTQLKLNGQEKILDEGYLFKGSLDLFFFGFYGMNLYKP